MLQHKTPGKGGLRYRLTGVVRTLVHKHKNSQADNGKGEKFKVVGFGKSSFLRNRGSKAILVSWQRISLA